MIVTEPHALVYRWPPSIFAYFQESSCGALPPTSISDSAVRFEPASPSVARIRTVLRRNELDGKRQHRIGLVFVAGKFVRADRLDYRQHVIERLPREIFGPLPGDFSRAGGRIKLREPSAR